MDIFFLCVFKCVDVLLLSLNVSTVFILYDVALVVVVWLKQNRKKNRLKKIGRKNDKKTATMLARVERHFYGNDNSKRSL